MVNYKKKVKHDKRVDVYMTDDERRQISILRSKINLKHPFNEVRCSMSQIMRSIILDYVDSRDGDDLVDDVVRLLEFRRDLDNPCDEEVSFDVV